MGEYELVWSTILIEELARAIEYPRIRGRIDRNSFRAFRLLLEEVGEHAPDVAVAPPIRSADSDGDYLVGIALKEDAFLISGDRHLTDLRGNLPVYTAREFLDLLVRAEPSSA